MLFHKLLFIMFIVIIETREIIITQDQLILYNTVDFKQTKHAFKQIEELLQLLYSSTNESFHKHLHLEQNCSNSNCIHNLNIANNNIAILDLYKSKYENIKKKAREVGMITDESHTEMSSHERNGSNKDIKKCFLTNIIGNVCDMEFNKFKILIESKFDIVHINEMFEATNIRIAQELLDKSLKKLTNTINRIDNNKLYGFYMHGVTSYMDNVILCIMPMIEIFEEISNKAIDFRPSRNVFPFQELEKIYPAIQLESTISENMYYSLPTAKTKYIKEQSKFESIFMIPLDNNEKYYEVSKTNETVIYRNYRDNNIEIQMTLKQKENCIDSYITICIQRVCKIKLSKLYYSKIPNRHIFQQPIKSCLITGSENVEIVFEEKTDNKIKEIQIDCGEKKIKSKIITEIVVNFTLPKNCKIYNNFLKIDKWQFDATPENTDNNQLAKQIIKDNKLILKEDVLSTDQINLKEQSLNVKDIQLYNKNKSCDGLIIGIIAWLSFLILMAAFGGYLYYKTRTNMYNVYEH